MASVKVYLCGGLLCFAAAVLLAWQMCSFSSSCGGISLVDPSPLVSSEELQKHSDITKGSEISEDHENALPQVISDASPDENTSDSATIADAAKGSQKHSDITKGSEISEDHENALPQVISDASPDENTSDNATIVDAAKGSQKHSDITKGSEISEDHGNAQPQAISDASPEENTSDNVTIADAAAINGSAEKEGVEMEVQEQIAEESCEGKRVYMYDLPAEFNVKILEKCSYGMVEWLDFCAHIANDGFGQALAAADWFATDAYMLEVIYHRRMQNYSCLTSDPAAADAFFVPYYSGLDALRFIYGLDKARSEEHGVELIQWLEGNVRDTWQRWGGSDHFVVLGRMAWDFAKRVGNADGWGTSLLELPAMANVTAIVLERRPWRQNEQAVPYPTSFHPSSPSRLRDWIATVATSPRASLFAFVVGALRPQKASSIRDRLFTQCESHPSCLLLDCAQLQCLHNPRPITDALLNSTFCLQPVGDSYTRRSTFESLVAGCIPVFFHDDSAYTQYTWHLPKDASLYSVFIPEDAIKGGALVADVLQTFSAEKIKEMQGHVKELMRRVLYAGAAAGRVGDAFDVSVEAMLSKAAQERAFRQQAAGYSNHN